MLRFDATEATEILKRMLSGERSIVGKKKRAVSILAVGLNCISRQKKAALSSERAALGRKRFVNGSLFYRKLDRRRLADITGGIIGFGIHLIVAAVL